MAELTPKQASFVSEYLIDKNATQAAIRTGMEWAECAVPVGFYVYALTQNDAIFYIGKGQKQRYKMHLIGRSHSPAVNLRVSQAVVKAFLVADGLTEQAALRLERLLIKALKIELVNCSDGLLSYQDSQVLRAKLLIQRMKRAKDLPQHSPVYRYYQKLILRECGRIVASPPHEYLYCRV